MTSQRDRGILIALGHVVFADGPNDCKRAPPFNWSVRSALPALTHAGPLAYRQFRRACTGGRTVAWRAI